MKEGAKISENNSQTLLQQPSSKRSPQSEKMQNQLFKLYAYDGKGTQKETIVLQRFTGIKAWSELQKRKLLQSVYATRIMGGISRVGYRSSLPRSVRLTSRQYSRDSAQH